MDPTSERRRFLGTAATALAVTQLGGIGAASAQGNGSASTAPPGRLGIQSSFGPLKHAAAGVLNVGYVEVGPRDGQAVILLHGWPYDVHSFEDVAPLLASANYRVIVPYLRGFGTTRFLSNDTFRNAQQAAVALDVVALMDALKIERAVLAGFDWGTRTADIVAALWPERCKSLVAVSGYLINNLEANTRPLPPQTELAWWYQYYFATERGVLGYQKHRRALAELIWRTTSPKWRFDEATFNRTAQSFDNPDHVSIVIHNYRWRLGLARGEDQYESFERRLSAAPVIGVPTITIASDFDGAAADGAAYAAKFTGKHQHRVLRDIGHNVPQEAPRAFAQAILDVDRL
ncbi:MAG: alpha/beta hydrolase [Burkholderiaceae bacterium]|nr:alpha/beta hydrolase [Burkholderiaceae bacterium]